MLDVVLAYLARGWSVVPGHTAADGICSCRDLDCDRPGKHPRVKWKPYQERRASAAELTAWWKRWPKANVIVITGAISGFDAVDVDPRHGGDESWYEWGVVNHPMPDTVMSLTGGGGVHVLFVHPVGQTLPNAVELLPGVDFRGDGGYIVAPPSSHPSGAQYVWDTECHPDEMPIAVMPTALRLLILNHRDLGRAERGPLDVEGLNEGRIRIANGERNEMMARVAGRFASVYGVDGLFDIVMGINKTACDEPLEAPEVKRIVTSIWRRQQATRSAQERELEQVENISSPDEGLALVSRLLEVPVVTDWYMLRGEQNEYVIVTPEDEVRLGPNLLSFDTVKTRLFNETGLLLDGTKTTWTPKAQVLRRVAREETVEPLLAGERISEWLETYTQRFGDRSVVDTKYAESLESGPITVDDQLWLLPARFANFIESHFGERMPVADLRRMLIRAGWESAQLQGGVNAWRRKPADDAEG